jgi:hypothetical protein
VRCDHKFMQVVYSVRYFCSSLNKIEFSDLFYSKSPIQFQLKSVKSQRRSSMWTHWRQADRWASHIFGEEAKNCKWSEWIDQGHTWIILIYFQIFQVFSLQVVKCFRFSFCHCVCVCVCVCVCARARARVSVQRLCMRFS